MQKDEWPPEKEVTACGKICLDGVLSSIVPSSDELMRFKEGIWDS